MTSKKPLSLTEKIILGMVLGAIIGIGISALGAANIEWVNTYIIEGIFHVGGKIFIKSLKMLVVPLVFISLVCGVTALSDLSQLGRIGSISSDNH